MKTGIVIEITGKDAIVMKNGGEFITLPAKEGWKKGDIIPVNRRKRPAVPIRRFLAAAAACLCLAVSGGGYHYYYAQAALISVDVNPSIELSVNRQDRVTSTAALNEDGKALLTGIRQSRLLKEIRETADHALTTRAADGSTEYRAVTSEEVKAAHSCGVTAGKYIYLQKLEEAAPGTDISRYSHCSIDEIKDHISNCEKRHQTDSTESDSGGKDCHSGHDHKNR